MTTGVTLGVVFICLVLSFFYSGMETGILSLSRARIRHLKERGSINARILLDFLHRPGSLSSTVLVANTLVNGLASILIAAWFLRKSGPMAAVCGVVVFSIVLGFFGELVPKALFQRFPTRLTVLLAPIIYATYIILWPIVQFFYVCSKGLIQLLGGRLTSRQLYVTRDELKLLSKEVGGDTRLSGEQRNLVATILDSKNATVRDVYRPKNQVVTVTPSMSEQERLELVRKSHSRLPIQTDLGWGELWVSYDVLFKTGVASRQPPFVDLHFRLEEVLKTLRKNKCSFAYVRDESGKECGIVTVEDVLRRYLGKLEI